MQRGFVLVSVLAIAVFAALSGIFAYRYADLKKEAAVHSINSFEECAAKYPVMESYPAQCRTPEGGHFVQELSNEEKKKLIPPTEPKESIKPATPSATLDKDGNKIYDFEDFTITVPPDWSINSAENGHYSFSGQSDLFIDKTKAKTIDDIDEEIELYDLINSSRTRNLNLGTAKAIEYYDCFGVEGCLKGYFVAIDNRGEFYGLLFYTHSGQDLPEEIKVYQKIISSLKFK